MQKRKVQLVFDSEISSEIDIEIEVPQRLPILSILFLIYTRYIFELIEKEKNKEIK